MHFHDRTELQWINNFLVSFPDARVFVVGGAVRDALLNKAAKDLDLVVGGVPGGEMEKWLASHGTVNFVGTRFGVWKFAPYHDPTGDEIDIALPRTETVIGDTGAYKSFAIHSDHTLPIEEDLKRRDFTMNAIAFDWKLDELVDPHDGQADIKARRIRTVGDSMLRFTEDSSRMLRAIRFAAQLKFTIDPEALRSIEKLGHRLNEKAGTDWIVPREVIGMELRKGLRANPGSTLSLLRSTGVWKMLFGELKSPRDTEFSNDYELNITLLATSLFNQWSEARRWLHTWHLHEEINTAGLKAVYRILHREPSALSLAQMEKLLLPYLDLILAFLQTRGHHAKVAWGEALLVVQRGSLSAPLVTGEDLQQAQIPEGPLYGAILDEARSAQIRGDIKTREDIAGFIRQALKHYDYTWG